MQYRLEKESPIPLYFQLRTILQRRIEDGEIAHGGRLPAEDVLGTLYGVSKVTVRQALKDLAEAGYVRREQGRGTFATKPRVEQGPRKLTGFTEEMSQRGLRASSRVLEQAVAGADVELARTLGIAEGAPVLRLKRLRLADGETMGVQTAHVPLDLAPGLAEEDLSGASLYEMLQRKYGLRADSARETHFAVALGAADARLLGVAEGAPALAAERLTLRADGRPIEWTCALMRGDRYKVVLNLAGGTQ